MAVSGVLAKQYVELATKGLEGVTRDMERVKAGLNAIEAVGNRAKTMFLGITGTIGGFVTAGLMGTTQANRMQVQMQMLSREIAGIFAPLIDDVIGKLQDLVDWFKGLSGTQQANIRSWVMATAAMLGLVAVMPKLIAGFMTLKTVLTGTTLGLGPLAIAVGAIVAALALIPGVGQAATTAINGLSSAAAKAAEGDMRSIAEKYVDWVDFMRAGLPEFLGGGKAYAEQYVKDKGMPNMATPEKQRTGVTQAGGNFEGVQETFRRIQSNVVKQSGPEERTAVAAEAIAKAVQIQGALGFKIADLIQTGIHRVIGAQPFGT